MIEVRNLKKAYGEKVLYDKLNIKIEDNSIVAIVGSSGSGKSTLLNIIGLIEDNYDGFIFYDNQNVSNLNNKRKIKFIRNNINYLFQNYALIDSETVKYNLMLALEYEKISFREKEKRIKEALKKVNLQNHYDSKVYTLSGGEQQRVSLARTILKRGKVILADEPTGNLDEKNSNIIIKILKDLPKNGKTVLIVTHNIDIAKQCDSIIELPKL